MPYVQNLDEKVAVVTGASSGIGAATARLMCASGMRVVLIARRAERLDALVNELGAARVEPLVGDVNDAELADNAISLAMSKFGRCDVLVNNAGAFAVGPVEKLNAEQIANVARTNVEAAYRFAFAAVVAFKAQGSGDLINVSSISGTKVPRAGIGWYAGTKHALEALTESLRMECAGTGVRVSCIEPGMTQTELFPEPITSIERALDPEDVAQMIAFVLQVPAHVSIPKLLVLPSCQAI